MHKKFRVGSSLALLGLMLSATASAGGVHAPTAPISTAQASTVTSSAAPIVLPSTTPSTEWFAKQYACLDQATLSGEMSEVESLLTPDYMGWSMRLEPISRGDFLEKTFEFFKPERAETVVQNIQPQGDSVLVRVRQESAGTYEMNGQSIPVGQVSTALGTWVRADETWKLGGSFVEEVETNFAGEKLVQTNPPPLTAAERESVRMDLTKVAQPVTEGGPLGFAAALADARLVGAGEGSHGTHEHFALKSRLFKELVEQHGFTTLAFEANMVGMDTVNAYLRGDSDDLASAVNALGFLIWRNTDVRDLLVWMREYNASHAGTPLQYVAVDVQYPVGSARRVAELTDDAAVTEALAPFISVENDTLGELLQNEGALKTYLAQAEALVAAADALPDSPERGRIVLLARNVQQGVQEAAGLQNRDTLMAQNLLNYMAENPDEKIMLWAHNGHVAKVSEAIDYTDLMGHDLAEALGDEYKAVGMTFASGAVLAFNPTEEGAWMQSVPVSDAWPDAAEALVTYTAPNMWLDLDAAVQQPALAKYFSRLQPMRGIGFKAQDGEMGYNFAPLPQAYDVLIFTERSTPATLVTKENTP